MNSLGKLLRRRKGFAGLALLMLALGAGFLSAGISARVAVARQAEAVKSQYTTSAIPYDGNVDSWDWMPRGWYAMIEYPAGPETVFQRFPELVVDRRIQLGAVVKDREAYMVTWGDVNPLEQMERFSYSEKEGIYGMAVVAARCERIESQTPDGGTPYEYAFTVEEVLSAADRGCPFPPTLLIGSSYLTTASGEKPFEVGKTYLLRGIWEQGQAYLFNLGDGLADDGLRYEEGDESGYGGHCYEQKGHLPVYAEYTGAVEDFLQSPQGQVWAQEIIPAAEGTLSSVKLILTDRVEGIYQFARRQAAILEGRSITLPEYEQGADVCLVSQEYAEKNSLSVGDTLSMELYHVPSQFVTGFSMADREGKSHKVADHSGIRVNPCLPQYAMEVEKTYTVVGIYTGAATYGGLFPFSPEMVYVPKNSVPQAAEWEKEFSSAPGMNSLILENGTAEEFEAYMAQRELGGYLLYADQGYGEMAGTLAAAAESAERLMAAGGAVFLLTGCVYLFLLAGRLGPTMRGMRILGVPPRRCRREAMAAAAPLAVGGVCLGTVLSAALFGQVSRWVLPQSGGLSIPALLLCAGGEIALLLLGSQICLGRVALRGLMQKREGGRRE